VNYCFLDAVADHRRLFGSAVLITTAPHATAFDAAAAFGRGLSPAFGQARSIPRGSPGSPAEQGAGLNWSVAKGDPV